MSIGIALLIFLSGVVIGAALAIAGTMTAMEGY